MSMNMVPGKEKAHYASCGRIRGMVCLLMGIKCLPLLRSRCKNLAPHMLSDLAVFRSIK
jgi:hypothetical protein